MAKVKKTYTLEEIKNITPDKLNTMTYEQLRPLVSSVAKIANRRYSELIKAEKKDKNFSSPALEKLKKQGKIMPYNADGSAKTVNQLRSEFMKGYNQLNFKTGTVGGTKKYKAELSEIAQRRLGNMTQDEQDRMWKLYNRFTSTHPDKSLYDSTQIQSYIREMIQDGKKNNVISRKINQMYKEAYEDKQDALRREQEAIANELYGGFDLGGSI